MIMRFPGSPKKGVLEEAIGTRTELKDRGVRNDGSQEYKVVVCRSLRDL